MNEVSSATFRTRIARDLAALDAGDDLGADGQAIVTLDQQAVGRLSRMDALQDQAMAKAQANRRAVQRKRLEAALARIEDGEFGYCEDCGDDIAPARLELDPAAQLCISCARR
ncbi:TraR/DksA family transcriptional regulator [Rhodobacteraceae bacterium KMM 6894]|nr:TraR/DksA family transcriptional regulator [Rhodobacteraceae bacterium KMM 6894]